MKPVAAYVRMSTEHQRYSIDNQLAAIETFCEANGMALVRVYSDAGRSGLTFENRPGLRSLVEAARQGALSFENVVVFDVSRWGRFQNVDEGAYYEHVLRLGGAPVVYCAEPFTSEEGSVATIFKIVKRAMAAEYSRELSAKVAAGTRRRASERDWCSARPAYGYRRTMVEVDGSIVDLPRHGGRARPAGARYTLRLGPPEEVKAVKRLFELYVRDRTSLPRIAAMLVAEGWPRPGGRGWCWELVGHMLRNEKYAGVLVFGRTSRLLGGKVTWTDRSTWVRIEDAYPAIIRRRLFNSAQMRLRTAVRRTFSRLEMIAGLQALHARFGVVTKALITAAADLPCVETLQREFGDLGGALRAAGLPVLTPVETRVAARACREGLAAAGSPR